MNTIIWDLDGTLIDSQSINFPIFKTLFPRHNLRSPTKAEFERNFHGTLEVTLQSLVAAQKRTLSEAKLNALEADYLHEQNKAIGYKSPEKILFADALRLMEQAAVEKFRQIIVTNRKHKGRKLASPRAIVANSSLKNYVSDVMCGDDIDFVKPDKRLIESLNEPLDTKNSIVIGDQTIDMELAKNLSCRGILIQC